LFDSGTDASSLTQIDIPAGTLNGHTTYDWRVRHQDNNGDWSAWSENTCFTTANRPPVAVDHSASTDEDTPVAIDVLANDSDPDSDALSVVSVSDPAHGSVVINGGNTVTYTPDADSHGTDTFDYTVSDGHGGTDTATVTVDVEAVNNPPVAVDDYDWIEEGMPGVIDVLLNDWDADSDPLSIDSLTQPDNGTAVDNGDGTITYTPDAGFTGTDYFDYTISDGRGGTDTATVDVYVEELVVNNPPVAVDDYDWTEEGMPVVIDVLLNDWDPDGDPLSVRSVTPPDNGTAVINPDGTITYTPDAGFTGTDAFSYTISDGQGGTDTATVYVEVTGFEPEWTYVFEDPGRGTTLYVNTWEKVFRFTSSDGFDTGIVHDPSMVCPRPWRGYRGHIVPRPRVQPVRPCPGRAHRLLPVHRQRLWAAPSSRR